MALPPEPVATELRHSASTIVFQFVVAYLYINPWSQGGTDASESLTLLCPPGNRENHNLYTLFGLHAVNLMAGNMKNQANLRVARASGQRIGRRRRL